MRSPGLTSIPVSYTHLGSCQIRQTSAGIYLSALQSPLGPFPVLFPILLHASGEWRLPLVRFAVVLPHGFRCV